MVYRPTERCKTICPLFSNGGIKTQLEICFVLMSGDTHNFKKSPKIPHRANFHAICFGTHGPLVQDFRFESMQRDSQKLQKVNFLHIYISTFL